MSKLSTSTPKPAEQPAPQPTAPAPRHWWDGLPIRVNAVKVPDEETPGYAVVVGSGATPCHVSRLASFVSLSRVHDREKKALQPDLICSWTNCRTSVTGGRTTRPAPKSSIRNWNQDRPNIATCRNEVEGPRRPHTADVPELVAAARLVAAYLNYDQHIPVDLLEDLRGVIWRLPPEVRRRVLNGWNYPIRDARYSRVQIAQFMKTNDVYTGLEFDASVRDVVRATLDQWTDDNASAVRLRIRIGTTQADALALLGKLADMVRTQWPGVDRDRPG